MAHRVYGVRRSTGNYQGNDYDNINLHCIAPDDGKMIAGEPVEIVKMKAPLYQAACDRQGLGLDEVVGATIRIYYDKYGNAEDFDILDV